MEIMLTTRQKKILSYLVAHNSSKCFIIASAIGVSEKTIRNEIKNMNASLGMDLVCSNANGFYIDNQKLNRLPDYLSKKQSDDNILHQILQYLLFENTPTNVDELSELLHISTTSLQSKIKILNQVASDYHIRITRQHNALYVHGDHYAKRKLFLHFLYKETNDSFHDISDFNAFFPHIDITLICKAIIDSIANNGYALPKFYETNLFINVCTILSIPNTTDLATHIHTTYNEKEKKIAREILDAIHMHATDYLIDMIAFSLIGIIKQNAHQDVNRNMTSKSNQRIIEDIIKDAFEYYSIRVDYAMFMQILIVHIDELIHRMRSPYTCIINTQIDVKENFVFVYEVAIYICKKLSEGFAIKIPSSEISLIAIHIGFAIESSLRQNNKINLAFYAFNYPVIKNYIKMIVKKNFKDQIHFIEISNIHEVPYLTTLDLFITTKAMIPNNNYEYCKISPLLTDMDKYQINQAIYTALNKQKKEKFLSLVHQCFDASLFFYDTGIKEQKSVLQFLTLHMQLQNAVDSTFLDSVLKREELDATCFMNVYALPHSIDSNALKSKIAVFVNPEGIAWGKQTVKFVFLIALNKKDKASIQPLFDGFTNVLADDIKLNRLLRVTSFNDFIKCIRDE